MRIAERGGLLDDDWVLVDDPATPPQEGRLLLPLDHWLDSIADTPEKSTFGVWVDGDREPADMAGVVAASVPVLAIRIPVFSDGRGYSLARMLRDQYGFTGDLRAIGDILCDQLFYLQRCGFSSFCLREDQDSKLALAALDSFHHVYQAASDQREYLLQRD